MKNLNDYIDKFGMIVTKEGDGGDSCAHGCAIAYGALRTGTKEKVFINVDALHKAPGRFVRHPDPDKWYSDLDRMSRDQLSPLLALLGLIGTKDSRKVLWQIFKAHAKRLFLFSWNTRRNDPTPENHGKARYPDDPGVKQLTRKDKFIIKYRIPFLEITSGYHNYNWKLPDITFMETWATYIRGFRLYPLYPLLLLFDLENFLGSVKYRMSGFKASDIQMNHVVLTDLATHIMPTPISLLSRYIYGKKYAIWALNRKWGGIENEPPVNQFLVPMVEQWKVRN